MNDHETIPLNDANNTMDDFILSLSLFLLNWKDWHFGSNLRKGELRLLRLPGEPDRFGAQLDGIGCLRSDPLGV